MKKLIPVILLSALLLTACSRSTESGESTPGTSALAVSAETTAAEAQAGTQTTTAAGSTEQPVSGTESTVQRVSGAGGGKQTEPAADTPADVLDEPATTTAKASAQELIIPTETAESVIVVQIPTDAEEESQNTDIIVNDDGSIILPPVSLD